MAYLALYRKWRPQSFDDLIGQDHIRQTLQNSLKNGRISHAYLFSGPRGTGKTTVARLMAKGLDCVQGPTDNPCGECDECTAIANGSSLNVVEIDGASNRGIEEIRDLREQVRFAPVGAPYKVYIIDEVHMLTPEAFNALLKTLEEPPAHVVFIFATTDLHKVPATILSRCQRYDFKRLALPHLVEGLRRVAAGEGVDAEEEALLMIAKHADGGMRDALSILEQCITFSEELTVETAAAVLGVAPVQEIESFIEKMMEKDQRSCLEQINRLYDSGKDLQQFARDVVEQLRTEMVQEKPKWPQADILDGVRQLSLAVREMRYAADLRIPLELAVLELTASVKQEKAPPAAEISKLMEKLTALEQQVRKLSAGRPARTEEAQSEKPVLRRPTGRDDAARTQFIIEHWEEYLQALRSERLVQCAAFLREGRPVTIGAGTAIISFPRDRGFHKASVEQPKHREAAERVLSKFVGTALQIECVFEDEVPEEQQAVSASPGAQAAESKPAQRPAEQQAAPQGQDNLSDLGDVDDTVKAALRIFGGKVVRKQD